MTEPTLAGQIAILDDTLATIEARMARGEVPPGVLAGFKSSVDDLRLRLWALLGAGSANDFRGFQERFRLRRAQEICRGVEADLRNGAINPRHDELATLADAATMLAGAIGEARAGRG